MLRQLNWGRDAGRQNAVLGQLGSNPLLPIMLFCKWMSGMWITGATGDGLCTSILMRVVFLFSVSLHYRGGEAVQPLPAQPLPWSPSGPGPPAAPGRGLDPVQGSGSGGAAETQRPLQQEVEPVRGSLHIREPSGELTGHWYTSSNKGIKSGLRGTVHKPDRFWTFKGPYLIFFLHSSTCSEP